MLSRNEILDALSRYRREHAQQYGIEQIGIFGSYARGQATEASDVDVYVRLRHASLFLLSRIRIELEELLGVPTDVVQLRERMNSFLKQRIEHEAIHAQ
jgi:predicted nucleotidyltransferase